MRALLLRRGQFGESMLGEWHMPGMAPSITIERSWKDNTPGESCVPAGFYRLEPHDGAKYRGTYALIGADVSHAQEEGVRRYACVLHEAASGDGLQGCISIVASGHLFAGLARSFLADLRSSRIPEVLEALRRDPGPHYLQICEAVPMTAGLAWNPHPEPLRPRMVW